jgi:hypothetical protein
VSIVDLSDYIGYKACFTEAVQVDSTATIVKGMTRLSMGPVRTHQEKHTAYFTPYSTAARFSQKSNSPFGATIRSAPNRTLKSKKLETSKSNDASKSPWAKLKSKTDNVPDISLFLESTGLGELVDHVDYRTGERTTDYSKSSDPSLLTDLGCRIYRNDNGQVGVRAVRAVGSGDQFITAGEHLTLKDGQSFCLCHEEGMILQEYELQLSVENEKTIFKLSGKGRL